jgi:hypothetical protein
MRASGMAVVGYTPFSGRLRGSRRRDVEVPATSQLPQCALVEVRRDITQARQSAAHVIVVLHASTIRPDRCMGTVRVDLLLPGPSHA